MAGKDIHQSAVGQFTVFLICIAVGMVISVLYDLFRIRRRTFKLVGFLVHIEDLLFWLICLLIVPSVIYVVNGGEVRGYLILGMLLGLFLYLFLFSKPIMDFSVPVVLAVKNILISIFKVLSKPFVLAWFFLAKIANFIFMLLSRYTGKACRKIEYDLFKVYRKMKIIFFKK